MDTRDTKEIITIERARKEVQMGITMMLVLQITLNIVELAIGVFTAPGFGDIITASVTLRVFLFVCTSSTLLASYLLRYRARVIFYQLSGAGALAFQEIICILLFHYLPATYHIRMVYVYQTVLLPPLIYAAASTSLQGLQFIAVTAITIVGWVITIYGFYSSLAGKCLTGFLVMFGTVIFGYAGQKMNQSMIKRRLAERYRANREKRRAERLIKAIIPEHFAQQLKSGEKCIAEEYLKCIVMFVGIYEKETGKAIGQSMNETLSDPKEKKQVYDCVNQLYNGFDNLVKIHGGTPVERLPNIYLAELHSDIDDLKDLSHRAISLARKMMHNISEINAKTGMAWEGKIGIHVGPVVGTVIGETDFHYTILGDTVNVASRLMTNTTMNSIMISDSLMDALGEKNLDIIDTIPNVIDEEKTEKQNKGQNVQLISLPKLNAKGLTERNVFLVKNDIVPPDKQKAMNKYIKNIAEGTRKKGGKKLTPRSTTSVVNIETSTVYSDITTNSVDEDIGLTRIQSKYLQLSFGENKELESEFQQLFYRDAIKASQVICVITIIVYIVFGIQMLAEKYFYFRLLAFLLPVPFIILLVLLCIKMDIALRRKLTIALMYTFAGLFSWENVLYISGYSLIYNYNIAFGLLTSNTVLCAYMLFFRFRTHLNIVYFVSFVIIDLIGFLTVGNSLMLVGTLLRVSIYMVVGAGTIAIARKVEYTAREIYLFEDICILERKRAAKILATLLPPHAIDFIVARPTGLKHTWKDPEATLESMDVTILELDVVGFTSTSSHLTPKQVNMWLNNLYSTFDILVTKRKLYKISVVGDSYSAVGGIPNTSSDHTEAVCELSQDMIRALPKINRKNEKNGLPEISIRIGIASGAVVGGVVSYQKPTYILWGKPVVLAEDSEKKSMPNSILVDKTTVEALIKRKAGGIRKILQGFSRKSSVSLNNPESRRDSFTEAEKILEKRKGSVIDKFFGARERFRKNSRASNSDVRLDELLPDDEETINPIIETNEVEEDCLHSHYWLKECPEKNKGRRESESFDGISSIRDEMTLLEGKITKVGKKHANGSFCFFPM